MPMLNPRSRILHMPTVANSTWQEPAGSPVAAVALCPTVAAFPYKQTGRAGTDKGRAF